MHGYSHTLEVSLYLLGNDAKNVVTQLVVVPKGNPSGIVEEMEN